MNSFTKAEVIGMIGSGAQIEAGASHHCFSMEMSNEEYHSRPDSISCSGLKAVLRSPAHYQAYLNNRGDDSGINIGTAAHCAVLEPERFDQEYIVYSGRRAGKAWEEFKEQNTGFQIMSESEMLQVTGMVAAIKDFKDFPLWEALRAGQSEKSIFWTDEETGIKCRIRTDSLNAFTIFDLKTTDDARPDRFLRHMLAQHYDMQAAMYTEGLRHFTGKIIPFCFIPVETNQPHGVFVLSAGETVIQSGMRKFRKALNTYKLALERDEWNCYQDAVAVLEMPKWVASA